MSVRLQLVVLWSISAPSFSPNRFVDFYSHPGISMGRMMEVFLLQTSGWHSSILEGQKYIFLNFYSWSISAPSVSPNSFVDFNSYPGTSMGRKEVFSSSNIRLTFKYFWGSNIYLSMFDLQGVFLTGPPLKMSLDWPPHKSLDWPPSKYSKYENHSALRLFWSLGGGQSRTLTFLAVQDSSIGDIVSEWVSESVSEWVIFWFQSLGSIK